MFDIGFWELCLVALVALIVFGPEKLPEVARTAGLWIGRARRLVAGVQQEIERDLRLQEMREAMKQTERNGLHQFLEETKTSLSDLNQPIVSSLPSSTPPLVDKSLLSSINQPVSVTDLPRKN